MVIKSAALHPPQHVCVSLAGRCQSVGCSQLFGGEKGGGRGEVREGCFHEWLSINGERLVCGFFNNLQMCLVFTHGCTSCALTRTCLCSEATPSQGLLVFLTSLFPLHLLFSTSNLSSVRCGQSHSPSFPPVFLHCGLSLQRHSLSTGTVMSPWTPSKEFALPPTGSPFVTYIPPSLPRSLLML